MDSGSCSFEEAHEGCTQGRMGATSASVEVRRQQTTTHLEQGQDMPTLRMNSVEQALSSMLRHLPIRASRTATMAQETAAAAELKHLRSPATQPVSKFTDAGTGQAELILNGERKNKKCRDGGAGLAHGQDHQLRGSAKTGATGRAFFTLFTEQLTGVLTNLHQTSLVWNQKREEKQPGLNLQPLRTTFLFL